MDRSDGSNLESRECERFLIDPPIEGSFGGSRVGILDIAEKGLRARHPSPLRPGMSGIVLVSIPGSAESLKLRAQIVWCRLSPTASLGEKLHYLSGFRFDETSEALSRTIEHLVIVDKARKDHQSLEKKRSKLTKRSSKPSDGSPTMKVIRQHRRIDESTLLLVKQAWHYMKHNPVEANKWYNRAKYALKESDAPKLHNRDDVLAIWEYLERSIPLEQIDWILDNEHLV